MSPAEFMDFAKTVFLGLAFLIAVTGITVRIALPGARSRLRGSGQAEPLLEQRISRVEAELDQLAELRAAVERLTEELEFQRQLALPAAPASAPAQPHA